MVGPIQALIQWANENPHRLPPACYTERRIDWTLDITQDWVTINPCGEHDMVPTFRRSGKAPMPILAVDTADYVLGATGPGATEQQATKRAAAFWAQMTKWATGSHRNDAIVAALYLLQTQGTAQSEQEIKPKERVAVRVAGLWLHRLPEARREWVDIVTETKGGSDGFCLGCGQQRRLAKSLPTAIPWGLVPGAEQDAQLTVLPLAERVGKGQLLLCIECGDRAASALRVLLEDGSHSMTAAGQSSTSVVFGVGGSGVDAAATSVLARLKHGPTMTTDQVRQHLGLGEGASVHRTMERRGVQPVGREAGRDGQDLWPTVEVLGSRAPGRGVGGGRPHKN
jgi:hypothetical protein